MNQANSGQPAVTALTVKPGDKVDNYTIMEQIGSGGTAVVFRAQDHVLNRDVAIKQIVVPKGDDGDEIRQRAVAEAEAHKKVAASDPKLLVQFIDLINDERGLFLISELVDGPSLEVMLEMERNPMDQRQALGIVAATAKALEPIHAQGMIHRDLKPSNILMPRGGGLKLADFGLAAVAGEQQQMDTGSVRYMAPETLKGEPATAKSDLYSLGIVAYEMLAGRDKFDEAFRTILRDHRNQAMRWVKWHTNTRAKATPLHQLAPAVPQSLSDLVERMMEKDPARRVGSSAELMEAIRTHFVNGGEAQPASPKPHAAMAQPDLGDVSETAEVPQRSKIPLILGGMLALWIVAIGGFFLWQSNEEKKQQAQRIANVHEDLLAADSKHFAGEYEEAAEAFAAIPAKYSMQNQGHYLYEAAQAGVLRAEGRLNTAAGNHIVARDKFEKYEDLSRSWTDEEIQAGPNLRLTYNEARNLRDAAERRASFQGVVNKIIAYMDQGEMSLAREEIQRQREKNPSQEDLDLLNQLDRQRIDIEENQRITKLVAQADALAKDGELKDAVELLDEEKEARGERTDERVTTLLVTLQDQAWVEDINRRITRARDRGERAELLDALRAKQSRMPSEKILSEIRAIEVQTLLDEASRALADNQPDLAEIRLKEVLEIDPDNTTAPQMLARIEASVMQRASLTRGDQLMAEGNYADAITAYTDALKHGPDPDGQINAKIQQANGRIAQANAAAALDAGKLDVAQAELNKAVSLLGSIAALNVIQDRIDELQGYRDLVAQGDEAFENETYGTAKRKYLQAQDIYDSDEIRSKIRLCEFNVWLSQSDAAIQRRDWDQAESALRRAEEIMVNEQTKARRRTIENRVQ